VLIEFERFVTLTYFSMETNENAAMLMTVERHDTSRFRNKTVYSGCIISIP
jgi:hypothetical protein